MLPQNKRLIGFVSNLLQKPRTTSGKTVQYAPKADEIITLYNMHVNTKEKKTFLFFFFLNCAIRILCADLIFEIFHQSRFMSV